MEQRHESLSQVLAGEGDGCNLNLGRRRGVVNELTHRERALYEAVCSMEERIVWS
jgi:hypothetical protein